MGRTLRCLRFNRKLKKARTNRLSLSYGGANVNAEDAVNESLDTADGSPMTAHLDFDKLRALGFDVVKTNLGRGNMGEAKLRADEIEAMKAQGMAQQRAQALHVKLTSAPATFASSFYLADAGGMVRLIMHEPSVGDETTVRGAFVTTEEALLKLAEIAPQFVARMHEARADTTRAPAAPDAEITTVDAPQGDVVAAEPAVD